MCSEAHQHHSSRRLRAAGQKPAVQHSNSDGLQAAECATVCCCRSINIAQDSSLGQSDQCGNLKAIRGDPASVACVCVCTCSRCGAEEMEAGAKARGGRW